MSPSCGAQKVHIIQIRNSKKCQTMQIQRDLCNYTSVIKMMYLVYIDLKVVQFILKLGTYM